MAWVWLIAAACFETGWALVLPETQGFTKLMPSIVTVVLLGCSMAGLAVAAQTLPIGTAYGVWVGLGAVGTTVFGMVFHDDPRGAWRILFLAMLIVGIAGLKATSDV